MARITESQLRSIVKQELKKILNEMSPMYIGSGDWMDEPDEPNTDNSPVVLNPAEYTKAANDAYVKSSAAWRYSREYQPKEGLDFSNVYKEYLEEKVYPSNKDLPPNKKVPPSSEQFIQFCLSKGYMISK